MELLKRKVLAFVNYDRSSSQKYEEGNSSENNLAFATRENGDTGAEVYSQEDFNSTKGLKTRLEKEFGEKIEVSVETCDEWVLMNVELNRN